MAQLGHNWSRWWSLNKAPAPRFCFSDDKRNLLECHQNRASRLLLMSTPCLGSQRVESTISGIEAIAMGVGKVPETFTSLLGYRCKRQGCGGALGESNLSWYIIERGLWLD
jgi:hypothetical protein